MAVNMQQNVLVRAGDDLKAHIPAMPRWLGIVRVVQLVLNLLVMILCAFASSKFGGIYSGYGLAFYLFVWTILFMLYILLTPVYLPKIYIYPLHLLLEFKTLIFWLSTFGLLATEATLWNSVDAFSYPVYDSKTGKTTYVDYWPGGAAAIGATKAAAAFAAFTWLSFMVTFVFVVIACYNHHKARLPMYAGQVVAPAPTDVEKPVGAPVQQQQQQQQPMEMNEFQPAPTQVQYQQVPVQQHQAPTYV